MKKIIFLLLLMANAINSSAQKNYSFKIAKLQYNGSNWYISPTALPNLIQFVNKNLNANIDPNPVTVTPGSAKIFYYPYLFMTGNGNVIFTQKEADNLRIYLEGGGFLHINDSYGMDKYIRNELKKIFPNKKLIELPYSHPIYHQKYDFPHGLPKIHKHNGKRPQGFGIFYKGRLVIYYDYESDIGDGWEDPSVHNDPESKHIDALKMGADILQFVLTKGGIE